MGNCCSSTGVDDNDVRRKPAGTRSNGGRRNQGRNRNNDAGYAYRVVDNSNYHSHGGGGNSGGHGGRLDLNSANVHELTRLPGIKQQLAYEIVNYRARHGDFTKTSDILHVPGVNKRLFDTISNKIYVSSQPRPQPRPTGNHHHHQPPPRHVGGNRNDNKTGSTQPKSDSRTLRIATWNLKCFSIDRVSNRTVVEIVCLAILNNQFDLIAFQELADQSSLKTICNELNAPKISSVKRKKRNVQWYVSISEKAGRMYQSSEYNGFVWNNELSLVLRNSGVLGGKQTKEDRFVRRPFIGHFEIGRWKFTLVSVHLKATGLSGEDIPQLKHEIGMLPTLMEALRSQGHQHILLLGDFNMDSSDESFQELRNHSFQSLLPASVPTNISGRNPRGGHQYDNIWVTRKGVLPKYESGKYGVVREGLKISEDETVSDHCPVWADIRV